MTAAQPVRQPVRPSVQQPVQHSGGRGDGAGSACRILLVIVIALQVALALYFGSQKAGFHEDEYYSYYSSNRTAGFFCNDRTWVDTADWAREFCVAEGEGMRFSLVHQVQSWDVHPPLYYDLLHLVCSLTPGVFSKWQGIGINIAAFVLAQLTLFALGSKLCGDARTGLAAAALWGFSPAAMSMIMFIRMYALLTLLVMLCAYLHADEGQGLRRTAAMAAVTTAGCLTHYYYLVFLFFIGLIRFVRLLRMRRMRAAAAYAASQAAAMAAALLVYPSAAVHILRGYRGREAQSAFFDPANIRERLSLFVPILDRYVFGGLLAAAVIAAAAAVILRLRASARAAAGLYTVLAASLLYFAVTSKTALQLGDSSLRYVLPVCPLFILAFCAAAAAIARRVGKRPVFALLAAAVLFGNAFGLARGRVLFLYEEEKAYMQEARSRTAEGCPAAVIYDPASDYNVLRIADVLLCYDRIFLIDAQDREVVSDPAFAGGKEFIVYAADGAGGENEVAAYFGDAEIKKLWNRDMITAYAAGTEE